jgi:hypothetical protein
MSYKAIPELTPKQLRNFWAKVDKRGPNDCWGWTGSRHERGYGHFRLGKSGIFCVTRIMYYLSAGKQPGPLCICHACDVPSCCNPAHLFLGTGSDNIADMVAKGRTLIGERQPMAKLTEAQVLAIRASGDTQTALAARYNVTQVNISCIKTRKSWKHI